MLRRSRHRCALAGTAVVGTLLLAPAVQALEWELVEPQHTTTTDNAPYNALDGAPASSPILSDRLAWELVIPGDEISPALVAQEVEEAEALREQALASVPEPTPWITGGLYQISRGEEGLPAISQRVPSGYGSRFLGVQVGLALESCNVTGSYVCGTQSFEREFKDFGKGAIDLNVGLGDPTRWLGIDLGYNFTSLATTRPGQDDAGSEFGEGQGINLALSRNLGPDWGLKVGAINLIELDETQKDTGRSAYAVLSGRIDLGGPPNSNTNDLYITAGIANGLFRPLNTIVKDQERACNSLRRRRGSDLLTPQQTRNCNADGLNYGSPSPVASVAWMINPQLSLMAEWWGRNLTLAASIKPIPGVNWVITPGVTNLVKNSDWDSDVPGYTERVRLQLTTSLAF
ncbi:MAG: hypothetical protein ACNA8O_03505 [Cyanobacteriota bacterium]